MTALDHLATLLLVVIAPAFFAWRFPAFAAAVRAGRPGARIREYRIILAESLALSTLVFGLWIGTGRPLRGLRAAAPASTGLWIGWGLVAAAVILLALQVWRLRRHPGAAPSIRKQLRAHGGWELLPANRRELGPFLLLAIVGAGIGEEILYRGYLLWYFQELTSLPLAILLSSIAFGLAHSYQGARGVLNTGLLGLVFAGLTVLTGTFWPAAVLHAAVDVHAGLLAWWSLGPPRPAGAGADGPGS